MSGFHRSQGFSLVELVTVIIIVSILSVYAASRFFGTSAFETVATRDALVSDLRRMQQAVMAGQSCTLVATAASFFLTGDCAGDGSFTLDSTSLLLGGSDSFVIELDALGEPVNSCAGGCEVAITGEDPQTVRIESGGYIHGK